MNEFDLGNYESARDLAKAIRQNADNINDIFNNMTDTMNKLSADWQSAGSSEIQAMYADIKAKYPVFYQRVIDDTQHILKVVAADEEADVAAQKIVDGA